MCGDDEFGFDRKTKLRCLPVEIGGPCRAIAVDGLESDRMNGINGIIRTGQ